MPVHFPEARKVVLSVLVKLELTEAGCCGDERTNTSITASNEAAATARTARGAMSMKAGYGLGTTCAL